MRNFIFILLTGMLLTSCTQADETAPTEAFSPTDTPPLTSTIIWFPPSATATQLTIPTYTATVEMNPGIGALILKEDFSDFASWDTAVSDQGSAAISRNRLTIVVQP